MTNRPFYWFTLQIGRDKSGDSRNPPLRGVRVRGFYLGTRRPTSHLQTHQRLSLDSLLRLPRVRESLVACLSSGDVSPRFPSPPPPPSSPDTDTLKRDRERTTNHVKATHVWTIVFSYQYIYELEVSFSFFRISFALNFFSRLMIGRFFFL